MSAALAAPVDEARQHIRRAEVTHDDETGWRQAKNRAWLWLARRQQCWAHLLRDFVAMAERCGHDIASRSVARCHRTRIGRDDTTSRL